MNTNNRSERIEVTQVCQSYDDVISSNDFKKGLAMILERVPDFDSERILSLFDRGDLMGLSEEDKNYTIQFLEDDKVCEIGSRILNLGFKLKGGLMANNIDEAQGWNNLLKDISYENIKDNVKKRIGKLLLSDFSAYICFEIQNEKTEGLSKLLSSASLGIGDILTFYIEDYSSLTVVGMHGIINFEINYDIDDVQKVFHIEIEGIGEIQHYDNNLGIIYGSYGIARIDTITGELLYNTGDLEIGKLSHMRYKGVAIGEDGFLKIDEQTGVILYITSTRHIGKIIRYNGSNLPVGSSIYRYVNLDTGEIGKKDLSSNPTIYVGAGYPNSTVLQLSKFYKVK